MLIKPPRYGRRLLTRAGTPWGRFFRDNQGAILRQSVALVADGTISAEYIMNRVSAAALIASASISANYIISGGDPSLIGQLTSLGLTTGLKLALDAGDIASWPGSGASWLDTSGGGYDFWLGSSGSSESSDPTFNGTPGDLSGEYWSTDGGDYFTYDNTTEAWINAMHHAAAQFTIIGWVNMSNVTSRRLAGNRSSTSQDGFALLVGASGNLTINISNGAGNIYSGASTAACATSQWTMFACSLDFVNGTGWIGFDAAPDAVSPSFSGSPSAGAASNALRLFAIGGSTSSLPASGSAIGMAAMWQGVALTDTQIANIFNATKGRYGL